jgi:DNA-binding NarL/FixJ family response regulator
MRIPESPRTNATAGAPDASNPLSREAPARVAAATPRPTRTPTTEPRLQPKPPACNAARPNSISVLVADHHPITRDALADYLDAHHDIQVVDAVDPRTDAITSALKSRPDVITLDFEADDAATDASVRDILATLRDTRLVFFGIFVRDRHLQAALAAGPDAIVSKREDPHTLVHAIRNVPSGKLYLSPLLQARLAPAKHPASILELKPRSALLTRRETEVLSHIAHGLSKKEIATALHLSVKTVDNHSTNLMNKLDIHDRVQLARYAIREGLAHC